MDQLRAVAVAVAMERMALGNPWVDHCWRARAVLPAGDADAGATVVIDDLEFRLHPDEAEGYLVTLLGPAPCLFVVWRLKDDRPSVVMVTASYGEAARMLDAGENVDRVPLPEDLRGWIEDFARHHYQPPEPKRGRKRYAASNEGAGMP